MGRAVAAVLGVILTPFWVPMTAAWTLLDRVFSPTGTNYTREAAKVFWTKEW